MIEKQAVISENTNTTLGYFVEDNKSSATNEGSTMRTSLDDEVMKQKLLCLERLIDEIQCRFSDCQISVDSFLEEMRIDNLGYE
ncbi:MAG: hypothetical protein FWG98_02750 [Candidatus Cloacimonetes bacterium]|nr:hypothetical protein [Candidatus Cloacimonadota bacterium]